MNLTDRIEQFRSAMEALNYHIDELEKHIDNIQKSLCDLTRYVKEHIDKIDSIEIILKELTWPEIADIVIKYCRKHYMKKEYLKRIELEKLLKWLKTPGNRIHSCINDIEPIEKALREQYRNSIEKDKEELRGK